MGQLKPTQAVRDRTSEGAFAVPKKLALSKLFWDGATVDGDKIGASANRLVMQGASQQLFASTTFTSDQNGGVGVGDGGQ